MDTHFAEPLRIEQIAASLFLSADRFTEIFTRAMGRTPRDYLRHLRLERARALLAKTDEAVAEIGVQAEFGEPAYFIRVFREATGMTPSPYRR
jgi:transcriptional regulator GlxA family with amidase domain